MNQRNNLKKMNIVIPPISYKRLIVKSVIIIEVNYMEDTLRYFFSAIFQGFSAIVALAAMYFLYFFENTRNIKNEIIMKLQEFVGNKRKADRIGLIQYFKEEVLSRKADNESYNQIDFLVSKHDKLVNKESSVKSKLAILLKNVLIILFISMISLFLVGYNSYLDYLLVIAGVILIIFSIKYLLLIKKTILTIIED